jgi:hypothetical protein
MTYIDVIYAVRRPVQHSSSCWNRSVGSLERERAAVGCPHAEVLPFYYYFRVIIRGVSGVKGN